MHDIRIKRIYAPAEASDGFRVLVDRIWPRGISKDGAAVDLWLKEVAPSAALRKWFSHAPELWNGFRERYRAELAGRTAELAALGERARAGRLTLLFGARDVERNQAVVLREVLAGE